MPFLLMSHCPIALLVKMEVFYESSTVQYVSHQSREPIEHLNTASPNWGTSLVWNTHQISKIWYEKKNVSNLINNLSISYMLKWLYFEKMKLRYIIKIHFTYFSFLVSMWLLEHLKLHRQLYFISVGQCWFICLV